MKSIIALFAVVSAGLLGCQRSPQYQKDQDVAKADYPMSNYYDKTSQTRSSTQRVEAMGQPKKRVLILNFFNDTPIRSNDLGLFAADELRRGLFLTQRMILPTDAKTDLSTQDFIQGDRVKVAQLIREGRKLGVAVLGIGRISKVVFRQRGDDVGVFRQRQSIAAVDVEMKLFDVTTGRELMAIAKSGEASSNAMVAFDQNNIESPQYRAELTKMAVRDAMGTLVQPVIKSVEKMQWEGRIAKIAGNKVYVNAGRASGLVGGDILKVISPGDDVYDPATGALLGRSQGRLKGTLEVVDFIGTDGAVAEIHTGANFTEGDSVQLY
ncbi:MAG: hypothetical protein ACXWP5_15720 [Bdellovibrionota bacterium]